MPGEGWGAAKHNGATGSGYTANLNVATPTPYSVSGAPDAIFLGLSVSNSNANYSGLGNHHLRWRIGTGTITLLDTIFTGYKQIKCYKTFPASQLANGNTPLRFDIINDQGALTDYQAYTYYSVKYPRIPNLQGSNNINFFVQNKSGQSKIRLDLTNAGGSNPIVLVQGDTPRMVPIVQNGTYKTCLIPNSTGGQEQFVIYKDSSLIQSIDAVHPINGTGNFTDFLSLSIDSALLMIYHKALEPASIEYANYRSSLAGGGYNVILCKCR